MLVSLGNHAKSTLTAFCAGDSLVTFTQRASGLSETSIRLAYTAVASVISVVALLCILLHRTLPCWHIRCRWKQDHR